MPQCSIKEKYFSRLLSSLLFCSPLSQGGVCLQALFWESFRKQFPMEMRRPNLCLLGKVLCKSCVWIRLLALCVAVNYILGTQKNSRKIPCVHPNLKEWKRSVILDEVSCLPLVRLLTTMKSEQGSSGSNELLQVLQELAHRCLGFFMSPVRIKNLPLAGRRPRIWEAEQYEVEAHFIYPVSQEGCPGHHDIWHMVGMRAYSAHHLRRLPLCKPPARMLWWVSVWKKTRAM